MIRNNSWLRLYNIVTLLIIVGCALYFYLLVDKNKTILAKIRNECGENIDCYRARADSDFDNNKRQLFIEGLQEANTEKDNYIMYLFAAKHINMVYAGDVGDDRLLVYDSVMAERIKAAEGIDYFDKCIDTVRKKSRRLHLHDTTDLTEMKRHHKSGIGF